MSLIIFPVMISEKKKENIKNFSFHELQMKLEEFDWEMYRADQIFNWLYVRKAEYFGEMLNIPKDLRNKLSEAFEIQSLKLVKNIFSDSTGTVKYLFKTWDDKNIESVIIPDKNKNTLCISSQVGCPLDCKFCATGLMGFRRNLTAAEIIDQYILVSNLLEGTKITNIVYMGMGEPLLNYDSTLKSLEIFTDQKNNGLSRNRITVSTAGIPKKIYELADSGLKVKLALSLHSCFDDIRNKIMPINIKFSLSELKKALVYYAKKTKTRITFEYTMLRDLNDREEDIRELSKFCSHIPSKVNIIPFNSIKHMNPGGISAELESTEYKKILQFADRLRERNITVMIRQTQGDDIAAACGQLAIKHN